MKSICMILLCIFVLNILNDSCTIVEARPERGTWLRSLNPFVSYEQKQNKTNLELTIRFKKLLDPLHESIAKLRALYNHGFTQENLPIVYELVMKIIEPIEDFINDIFQDRFLCNLVRPLTVNLMLSPLKIVSQNFLDIAGKTMDVMIGVESNNNETMELAIGLGKRIFDFEVNIVELLIEFVDDYTSRVNANTIRARAILTPIVRFISQTINSLTQLTNRLLAITSDTKSPAMLNLTQYISSELKDIQSRSLKLEPKLSNPTYRQFIDRYSEQLRRTLTSINTVREEVMEEVYFVVIKNKSNKKITERKVE